MRIKNVGKQRPSQLITTFGPGAVIDGVKDSLVILDVDYWQSNGKYIRDPRLSSYLKVYNFMTPGRWKSGVPVVSFPDYHVCSNKSCNNLFKISEGFNVDEYHRFGPKCPKCSYKAYAARFITYCKEGHMDDFPWLEWVHEGKRHSCTEAQADLTLFNRGESSSLDDLIVKCKTCGAAKSMGRALSEGSFEKYVCEGNHPHRPSEKGKRCSSPVIPSLRGASNVYFSVIRSAISIPPWVNPIDNLIDEHYKDLINYRKDFGEMGVNKIFSNYFEDSFSRKEFDEAIVRREGDIKDYYTVKEMEYKAILDHKSQKIKKVERTFKAVEEEVDPMLKKYFSRVIRLERLREVMVLLGFMRNSMPEPDVDVDEKHGMVKLRKNKDNWLPAVENFGEGIFIEFNKKTIEKFFNEGKNSKLRQKYKLLYDEYLSSKDWNNQMPKDGAYVLIHSFAHLLIKELSDTCGYSSSALKERIYYGADMCGMLIYTGSSDSEGSLGGIVEMGKMDKLVELIANGLENSLDCTSDPICSLSKPSLSNNRLSGASCHSCNMIPETACEIGNRFLDRSLLLSITERKGYFDELLRELCGIEI